MRLRSERIVTAAGVVSGEVQIADGRIAWVGERTGHPAVDLGARWLAPGFIDLHVHGGGGAQFNTADPAEVAAAARFHARHGVTGLLATIVAAPVAQLVAALGAIRGEMELGSSGAIVLGAHLEGPFLSPHQPGAMDPAAFLAPEPEALRRLLLAGDGCMAMMTVAPELPRALGMIGELVEAGVVVSLGHSEASYEQASAAVQAGARSATHVFNAMAPFHHRAPGLLGAALELAEVNCELICDGVHVDPVAARLAYRLKGGAGLRLVTDAIAAAGMPDGGGYRLGDVAVEVVGGRAVRAGGKVLAGSTLTMDRAVGNAVRFLGIGVEEAVALASSNPARQLGLEDCKGAIAPGMDADLAVLDEDLRACGTVVGGEWLVEPAPPG